MFRLLIECTKNIDSLSINFSDGTSVVTESNECRNTRDDIEVPHVESTHGTKEHVKALNVPDVGSRPPKIDDNLNNLEF